MQYYIGIITGAILLLGALGILGFGGEMIELAVPILGKIKTSSPFIIFAMIGFTLIVTYSKLIPTQGLINVDGSITSQKPVDIYSSPSLPRSTIKISPGPFTPRSQNWIMPDTGPSS